MRDLTCALQIICSRDGAACLLNFAANALSRRLEFNLTSKPLTGHLPGWQACRTCNQHQPEASTAEAILIAYAPNPVLAGPVCVGGGGGGGSCGGGTPERTRYTTYANIDVP